MTSVFDATCCIQTGVCTENVGLEVRNESAGAEAQQSNLPEEATGFRFIDAVFVVAVSTSLSWYYSRQ